MRASLFFRVTKLFFLAVHFLIGEEQWFVDRVAFLSQNMIFFAVWTIPDSDRSPLPCHGSALPNELMAQKPLSITNIIWQIFPEESTSLEKTFDYKWKS